MTLAGAPIASSISGYIIIYVVLPLLVAAVIGVVRWAAKLNSRLATQDQALALLIQEVKPEGSPSLRELVGRHDRLTAITKQRLDDHLRQSHRPAQA